MFYCNHTYLKLSFSDIRLPQICTQMKAWSSEHWKNCRYLPGKSVVSVHGQKCGHPLTGKSVVSAHRQKYDHLPHKIGRKIKKYYLLIDKNVATCPKDKLMATCRTYKGSLKQKCGCQINAFLPHHPVSVLCLYFGNSTFRKVQCQVFPNPSYVKEKLERVQTS